MWAVSYAAPAINMQKFSCENHQFTPTKVSRTSIYNVPLHTHTPPCSCLYTSMHVPPYNIPPYTLTHTQTLTHSHTPCTPLSHTLTHSYTLSHTLTHSHTLSHSHTLTYHTSPLSVSYECHQRTGGGCNEPTTPDNQNTLCNEKESR